MLPGAVVLAAEDAVAVFGGEGGAVREVLVHDVGPVAAGVGDEVEESGVLWVWGVLVKLIVVGCGFGLGVCWAW